MTDLSQAYSEAKSLPDEVLARELKSGTGMIPGYILLGEMQERRSLRSSTAATPKTTSMLEEYVGSVQPYVPRRGPSTGIAGLAAQAGPQRYSNGGIVALAGGGRVSEVEQYLRERARALGMNEDIVVRVARSEGGLSDPFRRAEGPAPKSQIYPGTENSYGPLQLYISGKNAGLGDRALAAGIDPRTNWKGGVDFALNEANRVGWGQWYGAAKAGVGKWDGTAKGAQMPVTPGTVGTQAVAPVQTAATDPATGMTSIVPATEVATTSVPVEGGGGGDILGTMMMMQMLGGMGQQKPTDSVVHQQVKPSAPVDPYAVVAATSMTPDHYRKRRNRAYG